jgi:hypothetical protein
MSAAPSASTVARDCRTRAASHARWRNANKDIAIRPSLGIRSSIVAYDPSPRIALLRRALQLEGGDIACSCATCIGFDRVSIAERGEMPDERVIGRAHRPARGDRSPLGDAFAAR